MSDSNSNSESSASSSDSSDFEGAIGGDIIEESIEPFSGIQPWRFEPPARSRATQEREDILEPPRLGCDLDSEEWCLCSNCQKMLREEENICCQEIYAIKRKNLEAVDVEQLDDPPSCIVNHPGFQAVCLNVWVLQAAWFQYKQQYGKDAYEGPQLKKK